MVVNILIILVSIFVLFILGLATYYLYMQNMLSRKEYPKDVKIRFINNINYFVHAFFRLKIEVVNSELLPKDDGFVIIGNHQSNLDPFGIFKLNRLFGFIAKIEIENIITVKKHFKWTNGLFIDRDDVRQNIRIINEGAEFVKEGTNMVIFPEGTRSKDGQLLEFKLGSLKLATKAMAPIVPVTLVDFDKIKYNFPFKTTNAKVIVLKPIYYEEYKDLNQLDLMNNIKSQIEETLKNENKKSKS